MAIGKGHLSKAAFKKGSAWNTPVACGAGDGFEFYEESIASNVGLISDTQARASAKVRAGQAGNRLFSGSFRVPARYEGLEPLIAMIMGTAGAPTTVDTTAKKHVLKMANAVEGLFGTLVFDKLVKIWEYKSAKLTGFTLRVQQAAEGARAEVEFRCVASDLDKASAVNTSGTMASVTFPANRDFLLLSQLVVRLNPQGGGGLASSDAVYLSGFEISVDRPSKEDDVTTKLGNLAEEPTQQDFCGVKGSLTVSKYADGTGGNDALHDAVLSKAEQKMDIVFTAPTLAGSSTQYYQWKLFLNACQFDAGQQPTMGGPGLMSWSAAFMAHEVLSAPTGFTAGHTDPLVMEIYSQRSTDPLA
jgi:hypothetical protein